MAARLRGHDFEHNEIWDVVFPFHHWLLSR